jgi:hypothetical protein
MVSSVEATLYEGSETLEVVGESYQQDNLWAIVGEAPSPRRIQHDAVAVLVPETGNTHDANAIGVWISGLQVGYLSRDDAAQYRPGLDELAAKGPVALRATIVGGGYGDSRAILGVFLHHDPADFGMPRAAYSMHIGGELRTGLSEAFVTDLEDDSYDLGWLNDLPQDTRRAVARLRALLSAVHDPIDRHFMFCELEWRLYRLRDFEPNALADYDAVCEQHDGEMDRIAPALLAKFGAMPLLETYKQQCVRQQKAKDFARGLWWAERGLALYAEAAASQDWTDDLRKRRSTFQAKLSAPAPRPRPASAEQVQVTGELEVLTCTQCGCTWERVRVSGRKPRLCPSCVGEDREERAPV